MTTFGFSAFLKLIHLNERPKRTELRKRLRGSSAGGYDYHRSLRSYGKKLILEGAELSEMLLEADSITKPAERNSAKSGLTILDAWRSENVVGNFPCEPVTIESPASIFKICYKPDFGVSLKGTKTAVHVWNTMRPNLERRMVLAAMAPFFEEFANQGFNEVAVLSLRDGQLYNLADPTPYLAHSTILIDYIERLIEEINEDGPRPPAEDRPAL